jgi:hypothetical protein
VTWIPIFDRVEIDEAKLLNYVLSEAHPRGRHKARVFRSRLGLSLNDAGLLRQALLDAATAPDAPFQFKGVDAYGEHLSLDFALSTPVGSAIIRSTWIVRFGETVLRFVSCYPPRR